MFADYTSLPVGTQSIAPNEPSVGASAKLAEQRRSLGDCVSIPCPLPINRPTGAANISTPGDTVRTQSIAPNEPSVGADLSCPLPIYRPTGAANISTPVIRTTQSIAPDKKEEQPARPSPVAHNIPPMLSLEDGRPQGPYTQSPGLRPGTTPLPPLWEQRNIPVQGGRQRVSVIRNLPPMPPLPMRRLPVPTPTRQKQAVISTGQRQYPHYHTLTIRQKRLGHHTRKHLRQVRASERLARLRFWATIWSITGVLMVIFMSLGAIGSAVLYDFVQHTQTTYEQQVDTLPSLVPLDNLKIYDSKGVLLAQLTDQGLHTTVKFDQIAPLLRDATVATEDKTFWTNQGVDLLRILRAALDDAQNGRVVEGGSTITQQLIKILLVGDQATIERKLKELVLTPLINNRYSKRDILEMYLNSIYYGHQAYGIDAAATAYFGLQDKPGRPAAMQTGPGAISHARRYPQQS